MIRNFIIHIPQLVLPERLQQYEQQMHNFDNKHDRNAAFGRTRRRWQDTISILEEQKVGN